MDLDRVRSLWQRDRVAGSGKSLRKRSVATTGSTLSSLPECSDESCSRDEGDGSFLGVIVDWSKHGATGSVLERVEAGRDVDVNMSRRDEADCGAESMSGNLCADSGRGRDIDLNMGKRDEADSGLEHFLGDLCVVFWSEHRGAW